MPNIELHNTLRKENQTFIPIESIPKMYVCGPTVYNFAHIGNARSVVIYDVLFRILKHKYSDALYVRNITDVDDKIIHTAIQKNQKAEEISLFYYKVFEKDMLYLNCLKPNIEPKVSKNIKEIIQMITQIIENGHGYVSNGNVYFEISTYKDYGHLSSKNLKTLLHGERVDINEEKRAQGDFVLWKNATEKDYKTNSWWESPWGNGRPGWHIECSAMSCKHLGNTFDIHGGGSDLKFPHHENEIAQSCCAKYGSKFALYWVHNGFVTVNGEKMSKSLNNAITIQDLIAKNINGNSIRYAFLKTHYRKPLDWTDESVKSSQNSINKLKKAVNSVETTKKVDKTAITQNFIKALFKDMNTPAALAELHLLASTIKKTTSNETKINLITALVSCAELIGLNLIDD